MADIKGTADADTLTAGADADNVYGYGGNDTLKGNGGNDRLFGGTGKDTLLGGDGDDTFVYNVLADIAAGERLIGGDGFDTVTFYYMGYLSNPVDATGLLFTSVEGIETSLYVSTILTAAQLGQFERVTGFVQISAGGSVNFGGTVTEGGIIELADQSTSFDARASTSDIRVEGGGAPDTLLGGSGNDELSGGAGNDVIRGGVGGDLIIDGAGADKLYGEDGDDSFAINDNDLQAGEIINGGTGKDGIYINTSGEIDLSQLSMIDVENINVSFGATVTLSMAQYNALSELSGRFRLNDGGAIKLSGKVLRDFTLVLSDLGNSLNAKALTSDFYVTGGGGKDIIVGGKGQNGFTGGAGNDTLVGNAASDHLAGGDGKDSVRGLGGDDFFGVLRGSELVAGETLDGGIGADQIDILSDDGLFDFSRVRLVSIEKLSTIYNAHAQFTLLQLAGFTKLPELHYHLADAGTFAPTSTISLGASFIMSDKGNVIDLRNADATVVYVTGGVAADTAWGNDSGNVLVMGGGNDVANGLGGDDRLEGGAGNDTLSGGSGNDGLAGDQGDDVLDGGNGIDQLAGGSGDDNLLGGNGDDKLAGDEGNDRLSGGSGNDHLVGGTGLDVLTGGSGADLFEFLPGDLGTSRGACDRIKDFNHAQGDRIDLKLIDANNLLPDEQVFSVVTGAFTQVGQLHIIQAGGNTYIEGNVNGDLNADFVIRIEGLPAITVADLVL